MRALLVLIVVAVVALIVAISTGFINLEQTQTAQLPTVEIKGGQAPEFKADVGEVNVGTQNKVVEVPDISVERPTGQ